MLLIEVEGTQHHSAFSRILLFLISARTYTFSYNQTKKLISHELKLPSCSIQTGTDHHCLILFIMILLLSIGQLHYPLIKTVKAFPQVWPHSSSVKGNGRSVRIWLWKDKQIYISRFLLWASLDIDFPSESWKDWFVFSVWYSFA